MGLVEELVADRAQLRVRVGHRQHRPVGVSGEPVLGGLGGGEVAARVAGGRADLGDVHLVRAGNRDHGGDRREVADPGLRVDGQADDGIGCRAAGLDVCAAAEDRGEQQGVCGTPGVEVVAVEM